MRSPAQGSASTTTAADAAPEYFERFESRYRDAAGDREHIPWSSGRPHRTLTNWLDARAPSVVRCGGRVLVVGCGLGEDAIELVHRGYEVTAFDVSPTAIEWAKAEYPDSAEIFHVADLFEPPAKWRHRFDLVVEVNTIQSLPHADRNAVVAAMAPFLAAHGHLLVICRASDEPVPHEAGPPWAVTKAELEAAADLAGLEAVEQPSVFLDSNDPPVKRMRALYRRADG